MPRGCFLGLQCLTALDLSDTSHMLLNCHHFKARHVWNSYITRVSGTISKKVFLCPTGNLQSRTCSVYGTWCKIALFFFFLSFCRSSLWLILTREWKRTSLLLHSLQSRAAAFLRSVSLPFLQTVTSITAGGCKRLGWYDCCLETECLWSLLVLLGALRARDCALAVLRGLFRLTDALISFSFVKCRDPFIMIINILFSTRLREEMDIICSSDEVHVMKLLSVTHDTALQLNTTPVQSSL